MAHDIAPLSTIPFCCDSAAEMVVLTESLKRVITPTRGDFLEIKTTVAPRWIQHEDKPWETVYDQTWTIIVHTGNIRGMTRDLEEERIF